MRLIYRDVRLDARGQGNKICIADQVALERGVDIRVARENCCIEIVKVHLLVPTPVLVALATSKSVGLFDCSALRIVANNHKFAGLVQKIREQGVTRKEL